MTEKRSEPRLRSLLGGHITFNRLQSTMDCTVRNIAPHGALVVFPHAAVTPTEFSLHIPCRGEMHAATVVWRHHDRMGVSLSHRESSDADSASKRRLRQLQEENERLREQLDPGAA